MSEADISGDIVDRTGEKSFKHQVPEDSEPDDYEDDVFEESNEVVQIEKP